MWHGKKERRRRIIIKIIIRNGTKTISLQTLFGRLNYDVSAEVIKNCVKYIFVGRCLLIFLTRVPNLIYV